LIRKDEFDRLKDRIGFAMITLPWMMHESPGLSLDLIRIGEPVEIHLGNCRAISNSIAREKHLNFKEADRFHSFANN
jgi:hypothetical protein